MIKRAAAVIIAACLSVCTLAGCGHEIKPRSIKFVKQDGSPSGGSSGNVDDDGNLIDFPSPQTDLDDISDEHKDYYRQRLVAAGDSIADGWGTLNVLPKTQVIAQVGVSTPAYSRTQFTTLGTKMSMMDTMKAVRPSLLYISLGMNDVEKNNPDLYVAQYKEILDSILKEIPDCYIVAANITPCAKYSNYPKINNTTIKAYNDKLREMISDYGNENVIYFDVRSCLINVDDYLDDRYSAGDGIHLNDNAYTRIMTMVTKRLNQQNAKPKIEAIEKAREEADGTLNW